MSSIKTASPIEMFSNEKYLDEPQDIEYKRTVINFIKEFKESKEDKNKLLTKLQKEYNKWLSDVQKNTNTHMNEMIKLLKKPKTKWQR